MKNRFAPSLHMMLLLGLFCLAACAVSTLVVKINTSQDPGANFSQYQTFDWYAPEAGRTSGYRTLDAHLRKAILQEITKKGLRQTADQPQLLLAYDVSLPGPPPATTPALPAGFGYGLAAEMGYPYAYGHAKIVNYQAIHTYAPGTVLVDVIDAGTRQLLWRGWAEEVLTSFDGDYTAVENYVDDILDKYPSP